LEAQACQGEAGVKRLFGVVSVCGIDAHQGEARGVDRWAAEGEGTANAGYKP
jgi:hypothetical protein